MPPRVDNETTNPSIIENDAFEGVPRYRQRPMTSEFTVTDLRYFAALLQQVLWLNTTQAKTRAKRSSRQRILLERGAAQAKRGLCVNRVASL